MACRNSAKIENFSGGIHEDLIGVIKVFKSLANTCEMRDDELMRYLPMILDGDAIEFFRKYHH